MTKTSRPREVLVPMSTTMNRDTLASMVLASEEYGNALVLCDWLEDQNAGLEGVIQLLRHAGVKVPAWKADALDSEATANQFHYVELAQDVVLHIAVFNLQEPYTVIGLYVLSGLAAEWAGYARRRMGVVDDVVGEAIENIKRLTGVISVEN